MHLTAGNAVLSWSVAGVLNVYMQQAFSEKDESNLSSCFGAFQAAVF